jgi:hypothetical protein
LEKSGQKSHHFVRLYEHKKVDLQALKQQLKKGRGSAGIVTPKSPKAGNKKQQT